MGIEQQADIIMFQSSREFDQHLTGLGLSPFTGGRAKGIQFRDGHEEIVIDREYYLQGGLTEDMLQAIVVHEQTELACEDPDADFQATTAEYRYIFEQFGREGMIQYHDCLNHLLGGHNSETRNKVFQALVPSA